MAYYFIMQSASVCSCMTESESCSVLSNSLPASWTVASRLLCPLNSGKNTGVESCSLLQGIFPTQRSTVAFQILGILQARILEWVAYPFSRGSSQPRNWTGVSCIVVRFFTSWATREAFIFMWDCLLPFWGKVTIHFQFPLFFTF